VAVVEARKQPWRSGRLAAAVLLAGVALPSHAVAAEAVAEQSPGGTTEPEILVIGTRYVSGIQPERDLDEEAIGGYDESTIDGLLAEVQSELGEDPEPPLILVNGERVTSLDDIGSLPVEALSNVKVLPHGSAVAAGGTSTQRVISLSLKKKVRSATLLAAHKIATDGDWNAERGEAILTYIEGDKRVNVAFKVRDESSLFEDERGIDQPDQTLAGTRPFAQSGNVVGLPLVSSQIDPLLSAAAGQIVTVSPIPDLANPTLADFVPNANNPAVTDLGQFRTLRPETRNYDLNGTFAMRLAPWLTGNATLRFNHGTRASTRGLPSALFVLPTTNPNSPFSTDVGLAFYGPDPLRTRSQHDGGEGIVTLNGVFGRWTSYFNARHSESKDETLTQRMGGPNTITLADSVDPFAGNLFDLVTIRTDKATSRTVTSSTLLSLSGPALKLPAGDLQATVEGRFLDNRLHSTSTFSDRSFHRSEWAIRGAIEVPLTSAANGFLPEIGELSATAEATRTHFSDAGTLDQHALGLTWEPRPLLRLRGEVEESEEAPPIQTLGNPVIVTSGIRTFDPLTGETVDVTQITGGNPDLEPEKTRIWRISGLLTLVPKLNLQLNAEYADTDERNFLSSIPDASAAVMLAFPDRFVRDLSGTLTTVDLRPINFDSHREKRFRYGLSLNTKLAGGGSKIVQAAPTESGPGEDETERVQPHATILSGRPVRLQLTASHSIVFVDEITIRPGLGSVDLLEGGAIGIGGGRVRHQLDGSASVTASGLGMRMNVGWRGKSTLDSRIGGVTDTLRFSPVLLVNLKAFAEMRRFLPKDDWAKGMRVSLNFLNITNDRQEVRDSSGNTPLQYQPGYRDPLGRTVELEIRKVF
jgi:iron complex outermembrane receptor protein